MGAGPFTHLLTNASAMWDADHDPNQLLNTSSLYCDDFRFNIESPRNRHCFGRV